MAARILGILFDLDETLHSRQQAFWDWVDDETRRCGVLHNLDREAVANLDRRGRGDKVQLLAHLDDVFGWGLEAPEQLQRFRAGISAHIRPIAGVAELLKALRTDYHVGLVTNGASETQRPKLVRLGLEGVFDPVIISGEVGFRKPDRRIFKLAVAGWNVALPSVLFVGDDPTSDIAGARQVGMQTARVGSDGDLESVLSLVEWLARQTR